MITQKLKIQNLLSLQKKPSLSSGAEGPDEHQEGNNTDCQNNNKNKKKVLVANINCGSRHGHGMHAYFEESQLLFFTAHAVMIENVMFSAC